MDGLTIERRESILLLTIDRDHVRNAIDAATAVRIDEALRGLRRFSLGVCVNHDVRGRPLDLIRAFLLPVLFVSSQGQNFNGSLLTALMLSGVGLAVRLKCCLCFIVIFLRLLFAFRRAT